MSYYGCSDIGTTASASFDTLEEATKAANALRDAGFKICNNLSRTFWEKLACGGIFDKSMDGSHRGVVFLDYDRSIVFGRDKNYLGYDVRVSANTIEDLEYAKSYVDKLH